MHGRRKLWRAYLEWVAVNAVVGLPLCWLIPHPWNLLSPFAGFFVACAWDAWRETP